MEWVCLGTDREGTLLLHSAKIRAGLEDPGVVRNTFLSLISNAVCDRLLQQHRMV